MFSINNYPLWMVAWNLFLAGIPCYIAYQFQKRLKNKKIRQIPNRKQYFYVAGFIVWFFFLPNTAYLITLVRHLLDHCSDYNQYRVCTEEAWMVPFFFTYALIGVPTFWYALKTMAETLGKVIHKKISFWLPIVMTPLSALAVLFGLVDRLNSWDIATRPMILLKTAWSYLTNLNELLNLIAYTTALAMIYYGVEWGRKVLKN